MTTGVALPLTLGFRMAGLRRGPPDNLPQASQVRKNLFGPIDHEENIKFVQEELNKISQADCKKWNFDFQAEKPQEGRYSWEPVSEKVPQAYEMRAMCSHSQPQQSPQQTANKTQNELLPPPVTSHSSNTSYLTLPEPLSAPNTSTTATPTPTTTTTERRNIPSPPVPTKGRKRKEEDKEEDGDRRAKKQKRERTQQKPISAYMKITRRNPRQAQKKEDGPPPLVKRPSPTSSTPSTPTPTS